MKQIEHFVNNKLKISKVDYFINRVGRRNIISGKSEKIFEILIILLVVVLVSAQIGLSHESTRTFFTSIDKYEGINVDKLDTVFKQGEVNMEIDGIEPSQDIKILVNGNEAAQFDQKSITVQAGNSSIIEVDGTKKKAPFKVRITGISSNINTPCNGSEVEVNSNIQVITRIFLK